MLVLTRKQGEALVINHDVIITVVSCGNGRVRLGIKAPSHVPVDRAEVHNRKVEFVEVEANEAFETTFARLMSKPTIADQECSLPVKSR